MTASARSRKALSSGWCGVCCTQHAGGLRCPGALEAIGSERHGWRANVETPKGIEAYGVLVAECHDLWRARILTFPNVLWLVPGGTKTLKFAARTPHDAENQAIDFIRSHCQRRRYRIRDEPGELLRERVDEELASGIDRPRGKPAMRKIRFLNIRYGVMGATDHGGTGNLSETGLFIITDSPIDYGQWINMLLELEQQHTLNLKGLVRWARKRHHAGRSPGMGVQLQAPPTRYLEYVRAQP